MADALKEYANTALPTKEIAAKYDVSASTLTVWAKKAKIALRGRGRDKMRQPDARTREILQTAETLTLDETGKRFGMSKQRVQKIIKRWKDWQRPKQSPFVPDDVIQWKGKLYTVIEGGPMFGKVRDERNVTIHNFYWNMHGSQAIKVDAETQAALRKKKKKKSAKKK
jgi:transposase